MARLRREPELFATLPQELLRYDGTAQLVIRVTKEVVEVADTAIPAGEVVMLILASANRDPARYEHPDRLDVGRADVEPLSFGAGIHYCLGAALAEAEIEIVFRRLLERFEAITLDGERPRFRDRLAPRGLESLRVFCEAAPDRRAA